jgi:hypothetical protein
MSPPFQARHFIVGDAEALGEVPHHSLRRVQVRVHACQSILPIGAPDRELPAGEVVGDLGGVLVQRVSLGCGRVSGHLGMVRVQSWGREEGRGSGTRH